MRHVNIFRSLGMACLLATTLHAPSSQAQSNGCGSIANAYGPFDYRTSKDLLPNVENWHFAPEVEALIRGKSGYLGGDLDYTLRVFPNHHRALLAVTRYGERTRLDKPPDTQYTVECYYDRALRFKPDDTVARMLFVQYLNKQKRLPEANQQMAEVVRRAGDDPFTHFNAGLVYVELKNWQSARQEAWRAAELGFPRTELRELLQAAGQWTEPTVRAVATSASAPEAASNAASAP